MKNGGLTMKNGGLMGYTLWYTYKKLLNMALEIVDLPSYKMVIFHNYVCLPEGIS